MADVDFLGVARPDQQFPPATASVWTVPSNAGPDVSELPPRYFDISIVPNNAVLHYNQVVPYDEPSKAVVTRKVDGVRTLDPLLDANPDQVWLYFMTYLNERPSLNMNIHCFHIEHYTTQERTSTGKGRSTTRTVHHTRSVTDMNFSLDLIEYVCRQWWRVTVIPSNEATKKGKLVSLRDAIEQYTRLDKSVKEIICNKQLQGWDFEALSGKVRNLVQANGHYQRVSVTFAVQNGRIAARSSSKLSRFSNSSFVRFLCVVSCFCLIFGPIYLCLKAAGATRDAIVADYTMLSSEDSFLQLHAAMIANAAITRSNGRGQAILP